MAVKGNHDFGMREEKQDFLFSPLLGLCCAILPHKSQIFTRKFLKVSKGKQQNKGKKNEDYKSQQIR